MEEMHSGEGADKRVQSFRRQEHDNDIGKWGLNCFIAKYNTELSSSVSFSQQPTHR